MTPQTRELFICIVVESELLPLNAPQITTNQRKKHFQVFLEDGKDVTTLIGISYKIYLSNSVIFGYFNGLRFFTR